MWPKYIKILSTRMSSFEFSDGIEIVFDEQIDFSPIWLENNWSLEDSIGIDKFFILKLEWFKRKTRFVSTNSPCEELMRDISSSDLFPILYSTNKFKNPLVDELI